MLYVRTMDLEKKTILSKRCTGLYFYENMVGIISVEPNFFNEASWTLNDLIFAKTFLNFSKTMKRHCFFFFYSSFNCCDVQKQHIIISTYYYFLWTTSFMIVTIGANL